MLVEPLQKSIGLENKSSGNFDDRQKANANGDIGG